MTLPDGSVGARAMAQEQKISISMMATPESGDLGSELLRVEGLAKRYAKGRGVGGVSLCLRRGEVLGFVGPNGAGKTTTLRMLAGLLRPGAGTGTVMGKDIRKTARGSDDVGYMPQKLALYADLTVTDNLRFRADIYRLPEPDRRVAQA